MGEIFQSDDQCSDDVEEIVTEFYNTFSASGDNNVFIRICTKPSIKFASAI